MEEKTSSAFTSADKVTRPYEYPSDHPLYTRDVHSDSYTAIDGLGRRLPTYEEVGEKKERFVGMFYFTWHSYHNHMVPINTSEAISSCPEAQLDYKHPLWYEQGGESKINFWNEPIFGFYDNEDAWVLRRHAEMLADAGIDVVIFDCSNDDRLWPRSYLALMKAWSAARADGVKAPSVSFLLNFGPSNFTISDLHKLYQGFCENPLFREMWFIWKGKPLILAYPQGLNADDPVEKEILDFFTFRPCQPSYFKGTDELGAKWGWLSLYPQAAFRNDSSGKIEQMAVGCSQNASMESAMDRLPSCFSSKEHLFGRNYTQKHGPYPLPEGMMAGKNFEEQWEYALSVDPEFIFVTSWNEWIAERCVSWSNSKITYLNAMVDTYIDNFSRDIEPTRGILKDYFYYQLVSYVRKYKGMNSPEPASPSKTIDVNGCCSQWEDVKPEFRAYHHNRQPRDCDGYKGHHFTNTTGRNAIICAKVAHDDETIYFMVRTAAQLTPASDPAWMRLFIMVDYDTASWEHYQYVLNRINPTDKALLEHSTGGWNFREVARCDYTIHEDTLVVAIPKAALDITGNAFTIDFKWYDNMQHEGDIMDVYNYGDAAPGGRFNFRYKVE
jgi:hypothetical protein